MKNPVSVEKYYLNEGRLLETCQMTYSFIDDNMTGLEPTFEVDDVILRRDNKDVYAIIKTCRYISEVYAELLDKNMKKTGKCIWIEETEIYHKLKDVEWV